MSSYLRWFATTQSARLYVVEYRTVREPFRVWIKWRRGFWELRLLGEIHGLTATYQEPQGPVFEGDISTISQADLDQLARGVREGWHAQPPTDFFDFRLPSL